MPIGIIANGMAIIIGGLIGTVAGHKIPERLKTSLTQMFGVCAMGIGISCIMKMATLPASILSLVLGLIIGELCDLENRIQKGVRIIQKPMSKILSSGKQEDPEVFMEEFISILVLFCASGTGLFGAMQAGITGEHSILLTKSILDFCTAAIFAANLGGLVSLISIPQFLIMMICYLGAAIVMPLTNETMLGDFSAVGGLISLATGFRIAGIRNFPVANMIPAMILAMPLSALWNNFLVPFL
mgnify:CR=1 FL=1